MKWRVAEILILTKREVARWRVRARHSADERSRDQQLCSVTCNICRLWTCLVSSSNLMRTKKWWKLVMEQSKDWLRAGLRPQLLFMQSWRHRAGDYTSTHKNNLPTLSWGELTAITVKISIQLCVCVDFIGAKSQVWMWIGGGFESWSIKLKFV